jgi:long-chain acyl-CoA synthetase
MARIHARGEGCVQAIELPIHGRGETHASFRTLVDLWAHALAAAPDRVAIQDPHGIVTYRQVWCAAHKLAGEMIRRGCAGRAVAILVPNGADLHIAYLAALLARATPALVNPAYPPAQVESLLRIAGARLVIVPPPADPALAAAVAALPDAMLAEMRREDWLTEEAPRPLDPPRLEDPAVLLFTGGTTGLSKGVVHTHGMIANAVRAIEFMWPTKASGEVWLPVAPMSHVYGYLMGVTNPVWGAGTLVVPPRFQPDLIVEMLGRHRVTIFGGGPAPIYAAMLAARNFAATDLSALAVCPSGGAPTPVEIIERWKRATGLQIHEGYGMTEMAPIAGSSDYHGQRNGSVGRPLPCCRVQVVDTATGTQVLPPNTPGEIRITSPYAMTGYLDNPEETARTLRGGWIYTGDIGHLDEEGFLFITDRKKDMVLVKGFNVFPRVVEEAAMTHPRVRGVAVVGAPDARTGERLVAFVAGDPALTEEELRAHLAPRLATHQIPAEFRLVEALPMTPAAKLDRMALRRLAQGAA